MSTQKLVLVPRYNLQASAGPGSWVDEESVVDHLAFKADWIRRAIGTDPRNLALVDGVRGDSMEPTLRAGDLILVNRAVRRLQDDAIYVVSFDGQLLVKRISRVLGGAEVRSDNPAYPPFMVRGDELDQLVIAGRVVWFARVI